MTRPETTNANDTDDARATMKDVSHTHPYTGRTTGHLFQRGPVVAADGGGADAAGGEEDESKTMKDVSHTPPNDAADANGVFERGREARDGREQVEDEE